MEVTESGMVIVSNPEGLLDPLFTFPEGARIKVIIAIPISFAFIQSKGGDVFCVQKKYEVPFAHNYQPIHLRSIF